MSTLLTHLIQQPVVILSGTGYCSGNGSVKCRVGTLLSVSRDSWEHDDSGMLLCYVLEPVCPDCLNNITAAAVARSERVPELSARGATEAAAQHTT